MTMTIYRRIDLKKYAKILYRWSDIITASIVFALDLVLYYLDNYIGFVAAVFAMIYAIIMTRRILGKVAGKIIC